MYFLRLSLSCVLCVLCVLCVCVCVCVSCDAVLHSSTETITSFDRFYSLLFVEHIKFVCCRLRAQLLLRL